MGGLTDPAVLTLTGVCGQTVQHQVLGVTIDIKCMAHSGEPVPDQPQDQDKSGDAKQAVPVVLSDSDFDTGHGGHLAMFMRDRLNAAIDGHVDERLFVIQPDGRVGSTPADYQRFLTDLGPDGPPSQRTMIQIDEDLRPLLSRGAAFDADPFVILVAPAAGFVGPAQLGDVAQRAADANAPITVHLL